MPPANQQRSRQFDGMLNEGSRNCMNYRNFVIRDPEINNGQPVLNGTRVTLRTVSASLVAGDHVDTVAREDLVGEVRARKSAS